MTPAIRLFPSGQAASDVNRALRDEEHLPFQSGTCSTEPASRIAMTLPLPMVQVSAIAAAEHDKGFTSPTNFSAASPFHKHVAVACTDSIDSMRLRSHTPIGVLPHRPFGPARRDDRRRTILCEPEPAIFENGID